MVIKVHDAGALFRIKTRKGKAVREFLRLFVNDPFSGFKIENQRIFLQNESHFIFFSQNLKQNLNK